MRFALSWLLDVYFKFSLYPLSFKSLLYFSAAVLKIASVDELLDSLMAIDDGICFRIEGGWLEFFDQG